MDRNTFSHPLVSILPVALRKESVDRNALSLLTYHLKFGSLSARRAWIEIDTGSYHPHFHIVALRKESVDRNPNSIWRLLMSVVALRKESVDRNILSLSSPVAVGCRSPQGERG